MTQNQLPKVLMISHGNLNGGAARAASRLFECLRFSGFKVDFLVGKKGRDLVGVKSTSLVQRILMVAASRFDRFLCNSLEPNNTHWKTAAFWGVLRANQLNRSKCDVINLHWLGHGMISLRQLKKIKKPVFWTLHDEWVLNSISHYPYSNKERLGFIKFTLLKNRISSKKKFILKKNLHIITLNKTFAEKLKELYPESKSRVFTIPNPVNTKQFYPMTTKDFEKLMNVKVEKPYILYLGGVGDPRKGWDLLENSLSNCVSNFDLVMIGDVNRKLSGKYGQIEVKNLSRISDSSELCALYSQATAVVIPSRYEGLPQVATESLSCGTPIIGFDIGGIKDIIIDHRNGILVPKFEVLKFAKAIDFIVTSQKDFYREFCRKFALNNFSYNAVGSEYAKMMLQVNKKSHS